MKIAFYNSTHLTFMSGAEVVLINMLPLIVQSGHSVTLYMTSMCRNPMNQHVVEHLASTGVNVIELASFKLPLSGSHIPTGLLLEYGKKYDYLYAYNGFAFQDLAGLLASKIFGSRFILGIIAPTITGYWLHDLYQKTMARIIAHHADSIHVLNKQDQKSYAVINNKTFFLGLGIKKEIIVSRIPREKVDSDVLKIVFAGRLSRQKNILKLLSVIERMAQERAVKFYICGNGEYLDLVKDYSIRLPNLTFVGHENKDLSQVFADKHVFLNLSDFETFCLAILEALANGLPVIATATDGICTDYGSDTLYRSLPIDASVDEIVDAIYAILHLFKKNPDEYLKYANRALLFARKFCWETITNTFLNQLAS